MVGHDQTKSFVQICGKRVEPYQNHPEEEEDSQVGR